MFNRALLCTVILVDRISTVRSSNITRSTNVATFKSCVRVLAGRQCHQKNNEACASKRDFRWPTTTEASSLETVKNPISWSVNSNKMTQKNKSAFIKSKRFFCVSFANNNTVVQLVLWTYGSKWHSAMFLFESTAFLFIKNVVTIFRRCCFCFQRCYRSITVFKRVINGDTSSINANISTLIAWHSKQFFILWWVDQDLSLPIIAYHKSFIIYHWLSLPIIHWNLIHVSMYHVLTYHSS